MRRVEDVLDCWFESGLDALRPGALPVRQRGVVRGPFPGRLHSGVRGPDPGLVLHAARTRRPPCSTSRPFCNCMAHGIVLGDDKRKMSKRLRNYPDPDEMFDVYGADAMRWFLLSSPVMRGGDLVVERKGPGEAVRPGAQPAVERLEVLRPLRQRRWLPGDAGAPTPPSVLDRYILAKAGRPGRRRHRGDGRLRPLRRCAAITVFLDALNNWYIRRSRDRFWRARGQRRIRRDQDGRLRHACTPSCTRSAWWWRRCCRCWPRPSTGASPASAASTWPTGPTPPSLPPTRELVAPHGPRARGLFGRPLHTQGQELRARLPLRRSPWPGRTPCRSSLTATLIADELNVKEVRTRQRRQRGLPTACSRSTRRGSALALGRPPNRS